MKKLKEKSTVGGRIRRHARVAAGVTGVAARVAGEKVFAPKAPQRPALAETVN